VKPDQFRALALAIAAAMTVAASAAAQERAVPSQSDWKSAKQTVQIAAGLTFSYVEMGPEEGQPVVLLHGYTDNSRSWSLLAPHLDGRRMIAFDLRGHGDSEAPSCCCGLDTLAADVDALMEALEIETADVVGHSLGSMTAATLAAYYPERVDELVLVSTAANMPEAATGWLWDNVPQMQRPVDPDSEFMMNWYWNPNPVDEDFLGRERAESAAAPEATWMGVLRALTITDWTQMAPRIEAPTLILWGDQDGFFGAESQAHVQSILPDARHITYEGFGHNMFWEAPERVAADINSFLND
jgi:pimeloyl-ACP methyl ester carboxylesterase